MTGDLPTLPSLDTDYLEQERQAAIRKGWENLARSKWWSAVYWIIQERWLATKLGKSKPSPWRRIVEIARTEVEGYLEEDAQGERESEETILDATYDARSEEEHPIPPGGGPR